MPDIRKWGINVFKHEFWLCKNPVISDINHTNNSIICKTCQSQNFHGNCEHFRCSDAEDIIPSAVSIEPTEKLPEKIRINSEITLETVITPATIPAVTKEEVRVVEVPVTDTEDNPVYDENNEPVTKTEEQTVVVVIEPEYENPQNIKYLYQWYKNGRKLFKQTKPTIKVDTSAAGTDEYYCEVTQSIAENGDGGNKVAVTDSNRITLDIVEPTENKIVLKVQSGSVKIFLPIPFKVSDYDYPLTGNEFEDWTIQSATDSPKDTKITLETLENLTAVYTEGLTVEIDTENNSIGISADNDGISGTIDFAWETLE
jgi:hypothetical protein